MVDDLLKVAEALNDTSLSFVRFGVYGIGHLPLVQSWVCLSIYRQGSGNRSG